MKAIIMAGGSGTRLRPLTCTMPKPMARIMNKPVMEYITELLKKHGITDIGVTLRYLPESIKEYFGDGSAFGVNFTYFTENEPLGTAGSVMACSGFLNEDFLVISGDSFTDFNLSEAIAFHKEKEAEATLILHSVDVPIEYGVVVTEKDGKICRFLEKPDWSRVFSDTVNTGIYILNPSVFDGVTQKSPDFSKDIFPKLLKEKRKLFGYTASGYWCDIGDTDALRHCHFDIFDGKTSVSMNAHEIKKDVFICEGAQIEKGAVIKSPAFIGRGCKIKSGAVIDGYCVIGDGVIISGGASVKRSILGNGCFIGENAEIRGALICEKAVAKHGTSVFEQSVIGCGSVLGEESIIKPRVKIWPYKKIGSKEIVSENIVWRNGAENDLFGEDGISGEIGADLNASLISSVGAAFGSFLENGKIGISSDGTPGGVMLKNAVCSGLMSGGARVFDFGEQPAAVTRSGVRYYGLDGAVHASSEKNNIGEIKLLNEYGADISAQEERKVRLLLDRRDYFCAGVGEIYPMSELYEYKVHYMKELVSEASVQSGNIRVLICARSEWTRMFLSAAAADLNIIFDFTDRIFNPDNSAEAKEFASLVKRGNYNFGAFSTAGGEIAALADEDGEIIDSDMYKVLVQLIIIKQYGAAAVTDAAAPSVIESIAEKYNVGVVRKGHTARDYMGELCRNLSSSADRDRFILSFDAVGAIIKLSDYLNTTGERLSELRHEIPDFSILRAEIPCREGEKGRIIKSLSEEEHAELTEGVRITSENGSVLIIPHGSKPVCRIIAEGKKAEFSEEIAAEFGDKIKRILNKK